jgi:predicted nucleic acid-binding protein
MSTKTILIDSNVLVYAINSASPKHKTAQTFLQIHIDHLAVAHQNILESLRILTHKQFSNPMTPGDAIKAISNITEHCHVIAPEPGVHRIAMAFMQKYKLGGDKIFDAYLASTASSAGITTIATDNTKDFMAFKEITVINPFV